MKTLIAILASLMLSQTSHAELSAPFQIHTANYKDYVQVNVPVSFVGIAKVNAANAKRFAAIAESYVETMRAQRGNISYNFRQSLADPTEFMWIEEWQTGRDLADHMDSEAVAGLLAQVGAMFEPGFPKIVILKK
jgi:quinol monooxygenase YgiN